MKIFDKNKDLPVLNEEPKRTRRNGHICTSAALLISITAAICSTLGVRSIFGGGLIILSIAAFIEVVRITSIVMLNKYFEYIRGMLRWTGLSFVTIACIFSMWSVSGYFLEQYHNISADATLISYDTTNAATQIKDLQESNKITQEQISDLRKTLEQKREIYASLRNNEDGSLTNQQNKINNEINRINSEINSLNKQVNNNNKQISVFRTDLANLNKEYATKSPEIQRLKPFAKMFGIEDESVIVMCVVVLLTLIFDPFAIFLIFWGNRIIKLADENEKKMLEASNDIKNIKQEEVKAISTKKSKRKTRVKKPKVLEAKEDKNIVEEVKIEEVKEEQNPEISINKEDEVKKETKQKDSELKNKGFKKLRLNQTEDEPIFKKIKQD